MGSSYILLEDIFHVKDIDEDGKKFVRVSRIVAESENYEMEMQVDINTQLYPVQVNEKFTIVLASTVSEDGTADSGIFDPSGKRATLADRYDYAMYGKIYKVDEERDKLCVYASYGGLLMLLRGDKSNLQGIEKDKRIYLLMRKVEHMDY